jgi:superfamily II DNA or RNA helicase
MRVFIDGWAWLDLNDLQADHVPLLRNRLTIKRRKLGDHPGPTPAPIQLYRETGTHFGVPREYFLGNQSRGHDVTYGLTDGAQWPGDVRFHGELINDQPDAAKAVLDHFQAGKLGGIVQAPTAFGKTVLAAYLIAQLQRPTLVLVHKEFLLSQWKERLAQFLPDAKVGILQADKRELDGSHVCIAMLQTLAERGVDEKLSVWPGLVIADEVHRISAETWSPVAPCFPARHRLGLSATPRRRDGGDDVFLHHIGPIVYRGTALRLGFQVKRVWTDFRVRDAEGTSVAGKNLLLRFLCASKSRNSRVAEQVAGAVDAGRKVLVLSERVPHCSELQSVFQSIAKKRLGTVPPSLVYTGKVAKEMKDAERGAAFDQARVLFATAQLVSEGFDYPPLDTLCLATPIWDAEQAVGRILRPYPSKKDPIVIDIRDDNVPMFKRAGLNREKLYTRLQA